MTEFIDLVDSNGRVLHPKIDRTLRAQYKPAHMQIVIVVLLRGDHVLVHARSAKKQVNPGDVDHICGGIMSGETPHEAAHREAYEETGVRPTDLRIIAEGVNEYSCYRYLFIGSVDGEPTVQDPDEVAWAQYMHHEELHAKRQSGELTFVDGFFADLVSALDQRTRS